MPSGLRRSSAARRGRLRRQSRALALCVVGVCALVAGAGFGTPALRPLGVALAVLGLFAIVAVELAARTLRIDRRVDRDTVVAGDPIVATLRLHGWATRSGLLRLVSWDAHVAGPAGAVESPVETRRDHGAIVHRVRLSAIPRGEHRLGAPWVGIADPFGLVRVRRAARSNERILALARTVPVGLPFWEGAARRAGDALGRARGRIELGGIRDYEPGDPLSLIHWTQTARRGRLQTKELHGEAGRGRRLVVVLDARAQPSAGGGDFEVAVSAAASLIAGCAARGTAVGLAHAATPPVWHPTGSPAHTMERALALVVANATEPVTGLVRSVAEAPDAPDLIVVVTPYADGPLTGALATARGHGIAVAVVLIGSARAHATSLRRSGAVVSEASTFEQLPHALDLMAARG